MDRPPKSLIQQGKTHGKLLREMLRIQQQIARLEAEAAERARLAAEATTTKRKQG